jgi:SP family arabinose:H+ symporter-like MFS transporter
MFAASTPPAILFALAIIFVPESPRWLMKKNRRNEALAVLGRVGGEQYAQEETGQIEVSLAQTQGSFTELFTVYRPPLIMGCLLAVFSQLSGINTVMYFGPRIFEEIGTATATAFLWEVSVGVVNIVFTLVSFWLIDRAGRKVLLAGGTAVQFLALALVGWLWLPLDAARLEHYVPQAVSTLGLVPQGLPDPLFPQAYVALEVGAAKSFSPGWTGSLVVAGILVYVASFAVGNGVVCWVLISEIFPNKIRGRAMSLATLALWAACFLVSLTFVPLMDYVGKTPTFWAYGTVSLISSLYVMLAVPETRRRSLEDIEASWTR